LDSGAFVYFLLLLLVIIAVVISAILLLRRQWAAARRKKILSREYGAIGAVTPPTAAEITPEWNANAASTPPKTFAAPPPSPPVPPASAPASPSKMPDPIVVPPDEPAKSVFISYRRQDSQHITGRIYDRLLATFGREFVFKDVDSIPLGLDFREHLREQVGHCAVLVAVIGRNWNPTTASGQQRLSDPRDHLRIEIESALDRHIPVIPVLVDGIEMPAEDELPPSLAPLAYHNGISVRPDPDFHHDADRLVRGIEQLLK
jgi:hypothetical protein